MSEEGKKINVKTEPKVSTAASTSAGAAAAPPKRTFAPNVAVKREKKEQ